MNQKLNYGKGKRPEDDASSSEMESADVTTGNPKTMRNTKDAEPRSGERPVVKPVETNQAKKEFASKKHSGAV